MEYYNGRPISGRLILKLDAKNKDEAKRALELMTEYVDAIEDDSAPINEFITELVLTTLNK